MGTDLTIGLANRAGTLASACDALGRAGVNIEGISGVVIDDRPSLHVLVADAEHASRALIDAGFELLARRRVVVVPIENRPGEAARLLRRIADAGINVDLVYTTTDGRLVVGADDDTALRAALGEALAVAVAGQG
jgi:hypothetical protein